MRLIALLFIISLISCSTTPSKYQARTGDEGYSDKIIDQNLRMAEFLGNSATKKESAELYAKFRAIEICSEANAKYTHILVVKDKTFEKEITQSTTYYPSYYYGAAPYYGRYGTSYYAGYGTTGVHSWNESYTYPLFEVYFECVEKPYDSRMSYRPISQSQMKDFVKDVKGAVQIDEILPDSPSKDQMKVADIIISVDGTRVGNALELYKASRATQKTKFKVDFFRDGVKKTAEVQLLDVSELVAQSQKEIIKEACKIPEFKESRPLCKK